MATIVIGSEFAGRHGGVVDMRGTSAATNAASINAACARGGDITIFSETSATETVEFSSPLVLPSNCTLRLAAGIKIKPTADIASACMTSSSTSAVKATGDGVIECAAATVPSFTSVDGLAVDVRIEDADGVALGYIATDCTQIAGAAVVENAYAPTIFKALGDSRFAGAFDDDATVSSTIEVIAGDTITLNHGPHYRMQRRACGAVLIQNFAVNGSRISPTSGRTDDIKTFQLPLALASGTPANEIIGIFSSVNDRSVATITDVATVIADLRYIVRAIVWSGRRVLLCLEPSQRSTFWAAGMPAWHRTFIAAQKAIASEFPDAVRVADCLSGVQSATGEAFASGSMFDPYSDDVHAKFYGAHVWEQAMVAGMGDWIPPGALGVGMQIDAAYTNLLTNPGFTGTGGTAYNSGVAPDSWTTARTAANSWDKSYIWGATHTLRANSTAYAVGDRISSLTAAYVDYDYLCITAGTSDASEPTFSQTLFDTTTDGTATFLTVPKFHAFDGMRCVLIYGANTADNNRVSLQMTTDLTLASAGLAVGDKVAGSIYHANLLPAFGGSLLLQARTDSAAVNNAIDLAQTSPNSLMVGEYPQYGRLVTPGDDGISEGWTIPATTTRLRLRYITNSKNGYTQAILLGLPVLRQVN